MHVISSARNTICFSVNKILIFIYLEHLGSIHDKILWGIMVWISSTYSKETSIQCGRDNEGRGASRGKVTKEYRAFSIER